MNPAYNTPRLVQFPSTGAPSEGYLTVASVEQRLPFLIRRVFWTYFTPHNITRGRHAHHETEMIIIAVHGRIRLSTELLSGEKRDFILEQPDQGVYLPPLCWHVMEYSHDAVQMVLASTDYDPADYIRSYRAFQAIAQKYSAHHPGKTE